MSGRVAGCGIRKTTRACVTGAQQNAFWLRHSTKQADGRLALSITCPINAREYLKTGAWWGCWGCVKRDFVRITMKSYDEFQRSVMMMAYARV